MFDAYCNQVISQIAWRGHFNLEQQKNMCKVFNINDVPSSEFCCSSNNGKTIGTTLSKMTKTTS